MSATPLKNIIRLPKSHPNPSTWNTLIAKQKALRLTSLLTSPESFSSTHERERAFTDTDWEARLQNPPAHTFVAVSSTTKSSTVDEALLNDEWVGSAVLVETRGCEENATATFDIYGLFVLPEARGVGWGALLLDCATRCAVSLATERGFDKAVVRVSVARGNEHAVKLYEKVGFVESGAMPDAGLGLDVMVLRKELKPED